MFDTMSLCMSGEIQMMHMMDRLFGIVELSCMRVCK